VPMTVWFECMGTPPLRAGKGGRVMRVVRFVIVGRLFWLLGLQLPVVRAVGLIGNQNDQKKQNPPKRVKCGGVEDA
ncbi:hypothetical protein UQ30_23885, partial [Escherichia coli]|uniref:hypothetical protein n=1 Tax=Escherichia coli TaxID=562 RepID=UPI000B761D6C